MCCRNVKRARLSETNQEIKLRILQSEFINILVISHKDRLLWIQRLNYIRVTHSYSIGDIDMVLMVPHQIEHRNICDDFLFLLFQLKTENKQLFYLSWTSKTFKDDSNLQFLSYLYQLRDCFQCNIFFSVVCIAQTITYLSWLD